MPRSNGWSSNQLLASSEVASSAPVRSARATIASRAPASRAPWPAITTGRSARLIASAATDSSARIRSGGFRPPPPPAARRSTRSPGPGGRRQDQGDGPALRPRSAERVTTPGAGSSKSISWTAIPPAAEDRALLDVLGQARHRRGRVTAQHDERRAAALGADERRHRVREARTLGEGADADVIRHARVALRHRDRARLVPAAVEGDLQLGHQVREDLEVPVAHEAEDGAHAFGTPSPAPQLRRPSSGRPPRGRIIMDETNAPAVGRTAPRTCSTWRRTVWYAAPARGARRRSWMLDSV